MQIKNTIRYHFILTRMIIVKKRGTIRSVDEDVEKLETSYIANGNENAVAIFKRSDSSSKQSNIDWPYV